MFDRSSDLFVIPELSESIFDILPVRNLLKERLGDFVLLYDPGFCFFRSVVFEPSVGIRNLGSKIVVDD